MGINAEGGRFGRKMKEDLDSCRLEQVDDNLFLMRFAAVNADHAFIVNQLNELHVSPSNRHNP